MSICNVEDHIIELCCKGDSSSWRSFVEAYYEYVFNITRGVFLIKKQKNDTHDVEEVTQVVFEKLVDNDFKALKSWDPSKSKLSTWLTVVTRRVAIDWLRSSSRRNETVLFSSDLIEQAVDASSLHEATSLDVDMTMLTERQKQIIHMVYVEDQDVAEVAVELGISAQTVRSIRHQALERMRQHYNVAA